MKKKVFKVIGWIILLLIAVLILSSGFHAAASASEQRNYPPPGELIDVGGHRLHLYCQGEGSPTVVLEAGMSGWSTDWVLVQPEIAKTTRVCAYDRAGYGWSEAGPKPRDSQQTTEELHTLLSAAGIDGEIVLVGHSLGGLFVQHYAKAFPEQVAGIVLVDSVHPEQSLRMEEAKREKYEGSLMTLTSLSRILAPTGLLRISGQPVTVIAEKLPGEYQNIARSLGLQSKAYQALWAEMDAFQQSQRQLQEAGPLPEVPLAVLSASLVQNYPPGFAENAVKSDWDMLQSDLARLSTTPQVIAESSGHYIHIDQPELVIQAIMEVLNSGQ